MKKMKIIIPVIAVIVVLAAVLTAFWVKKYKPTSRMADLDTWFGNEKGEITLVMGDTVCEQKGLYQDGHVYVDVDTVNTYLNKRFYWDSYENKMLYTTSKSVYTLEPDSLEYKENNSKGTLDYVALKMKDVTPYLALDYVAQYTALDYQVYEKPDRAVITYRFGEDEDYVKTTKDTAVRNGAGIKHPILAQVKKGDKLRLLEKGKGEKPFDKVMTESGIVGYIDREKTGSTFREAKTTEFREETYTHITSDKKINLVWHQVTSSYANEGLLNLLNATKGVNVVVPTWFRVSKNKGEITSLASDSYVERAHGLGVQVWGLCDDFGSDSKIAVVLSRTSTRRKLAKNLVAEAIRYELDGINIDFEYVKSEGGKDFVQFIRELGIMCRNNGIVLAVDNYPPASYNNYYDREEQAKVADYVVVMAYDEYFAGSETAGPVSSLTYVQDGVDNTIAQGVPAGQLIVGLPFYSRLWKETKNKSGEIKVSSEAYGMNRAKSILNEEGAKVSWDDLTGMNYGEFKSGSATYKMWLENDKSLTEKIQYATGKDVAGLAFWKLGLEDSAIWDTIIKYN